MTRAEHLIDKIDEFGNTSEERITLWFGNDDSRRAVLNLLNTIQTLSLNGASRKIEHYVDGDGAYSFKVKGDTLKDIEKLSDEDLENDVIKIPGV